MKTRKQPQAVASDESPVSPRDIVCTTCYAQPGDLCAIRRTSATLEFHKTRIRAAAQRSKP